MVAHFLESTTTTTRTTKAKDRRPEEGRQKTEERRVNQHFSREGTIPRAAVTTLNHKPEEHEAPRNQEEESHNEEVR